MNYIPWGFDSTRRLRLHKGDIVVHPQCTAEGVIRFEVPPVTSTVTKVYEGDEHVLLDYKVPNYTGPALWHVGWFEPEDEFTTWVKGVRKKKAKK